MYTLTLLLPLLNTLCFVNNHRYKVLLVGCGTKHFPPPATPNEWFCAHKDQGIPSFLYVLECLCFVVFPHAYMDSTALALNASTWSSISDFLGSRKPRSTYKWLHCARNQLQAADSHNRGTFHCQWAGIQKHLDLLQTLSLLPAVHFSLYCIPASRSSLQLLLIFLDHPTSPLHTST